MVVEEGGNLLFRRRGESAVHSANTCSQADSDNDPRVRGHEPVAPPAAVERLSCDTNHANSKAGVQESFVQILAFEGRHTSILTSLAVEEEICSNKGGAHDSGAVEETLA